MKLVYVDPSEFNLPSKTVLIDNGNKSVTLIKKRKSRIIMKDGEKILEIKNKLLKNGVFKSLTLKTNAPLCSKTKKYLEENGITLIPFSEQ